MGLQSIHRLISDGSGTGNLPPVQVTCLYENFESGIRARALLEHVRAGLGNSISFNLELWRFDWLDVESVQALAQNSAREAAMLLVSTARAGLLPVPVTQWVTAWSRLGQDHPQAMIALLPKEMNPSLENYLIIEMLQRSARHKSADFFCQYFEPQDVRQIKPAFQGSDIRRVFEKEIMVPRANNAASRSASRSSISRYKNHVSY